MANLLLSIENVDDIEFQEIDKSKINISKPVNRVSQKNSIFKQYCMKEDAEKPLEVEDVDYLSMDLNDFGFTYKVSIPLKRADIWTVGELIPLLQNEKWYKPFKKFGDKESRRNHRKIISEKDN